MKLLNYLREVKGEIRHVNFPTRGQTASVTALVIVLSVLTAYFLGAFDFLFTKALDIFIL
ncbi:MAG: preprotein translocase subunit SecE [Patescibacteria group bacterium]